MSVQAALVASGGVFVDKPLTGHAINEGHGGPIRILCGTFIARCYGGENFLNARAHRRPRRHVASATLNSLSCAFSGLW